MGRGFGASLVTVSMMDVASTSKNEDSLFLENSNVSWLSIVERLAMLERRSVVGSVGFQIPLMFSEVIA